MRIGVARRVTAARVRGRGLLVAGALLSLACAKSSGSRVVLAGDDHVPLAVHVPSAAGGDDGRPPALARSELTVEVSGLADMADFAAKIINAIEPPPPGAPPVDLLALAELTLTQKGFAGGWLRHVDLDGVHVMRMSVPHEGQPSSPRDRRVAAAVATSEPAVLVDGLPSALRAVRVDAEHWRYESELGTITMRSHAGALEVAADQAGLDEVAGLRAGHRPSDARVKIEVHDLDPAWFEDEDPTRYESLRTFTRVELELDVGSDRDARLRLAVFGPFAAKYGEAFVATPAQRGPVDIARTLPAGALAAWVGPIRSFQQSRGARNDGVLAMAQDKLSPDAKAALRALLPVIVGLIGHMSGDMALAAYVDQKGRASVVSVVGVDDEQAVDATLGELLRGVEQHAGSVAQVQYDAIKVGRARADRLRMELPSTTSAAHWLFGAKQPALELAIFIGGGKLAMVMGPAHAEFMAKLAPRLAKAPDDGLESSGGLAMARQLTGGCQGCGFLDPAALGEAVVVVMGADPRADADARKAASALGKRIAGLGLDHPIALAFGYGSEHIEIGLGIPRELLLAVTDRRTFEAVATGFRELSRKIAPSNLEVCRHVLDIMEREFAGQGNQPTQEEIQKFELKCVADLDKERLKLGDSRYAEQVRCVMAATAMDNLMACDDL